jgi:hypothetical protein
VSQPLRELIHALAILARVAREAQDAEDAAHDRARAILRVAKP